jgi:hypothetical protein
MIKLKKQEYGRHVLQKVVRQDIKKNKLQNELNELNDAATSIQNAIKYKKARGELKQNKELKQY